MNPSCRKQLFAISVPLILAALLLSTCGALYLSFGLTSANDVLESILANPVGRILLSPAVVLGGLALTLTINLWALCRVRVGLDGSTVYLTLWLSRITSHLLLVSVATLLGTLLLAYAFVENFRVVPR
jgi:hypothetical protein